MRSIITGLIICFFSLGAFAQNLVVTVVNSETNLGIEDVTINYNLQDYVTDQKGEVQIPIDYNRSIFFKVSKNGYKSTELAINDPKGMDSYRISLDPRPNNSSNIIVLDEDELQEDDDNGAISSILRASRDPFLSAAAFNFRVARFQVRGYDNEYSSTLINGIPMQSLHNSRVPFNFWGGLNDVMRNTTTNLGMDHADFDFGNLNGASNTNVSAGGQRKQTRVSYAAANRSYRNRLMFTHSSGVQDNGWSYTLSGSRRWAQEGYIEGTFYNAYSYFLSVEKRISEKNSISFTMFGAPQKRGSGSGSLNEMYEIADDNYYNPNWGYLNGEKKSARNWNTHEPVFNVKQVVNLTDKLELTHSLGFITGRSGQSRLDWYNAPDPRPDYYRYLPSYYAGNDEAVAQVYSVLANSKEKRQLNWERLFDVNRNNYTVLTNVNGNGETVEGLRSLYSIQENRQDLTRVAYNAFARYQITPRASFYGGASGQYESTHFFQEMQNLLGGEYWYDINQFVEREFPGDENAIQADLNNPNRVIREGDTYGYNYNSKITDVSAWASYNAIFPKVDFHLGAKINYRSFYRDGLFKNGAFPDNSFGKSETLSFIAPSVKGGLSYKINGRNYIYANASYSETAPDFRNSFVSPRFRNQIVDNPTTEKAWSGELAYVLRAPLLKLKVLGYYSQFRDIAEVRSFFIDGSSSAFVNFITEGEGHTHVGTEIAGEVKLSSTLSMKFAAGVGQNYIDVRPTVDIIQDNTGALLLEDETIYVKNFRLPGAQSAYTAGLSYNSPKYWYINVNANYFDHLYLDHNPLRRTVDAVDGLDRESEFYFDVLRQTRLDPGFTLDIFGGKSWRFENRNMLYLNVGVNNILNNTNIVSGGFEQTRLGTSDGSNTVEDLGRFPNRYFYAWGLNYFVNLSYKF